MFSAAPLPVLTKTSKHLREKKKSVLMSRGQMET